MSLFPKIDEHVAAVFVMVYVTQTWTNTETPGETRVEERNQIIFYTTENERLSTLNYLENKIWNITSIIEYKPAPSDLLSYFTKLHYDFHGIHWISPENPLWEILHQLLDQQVYIGNQATPHGTEHVLINPTIDGDYIKPNTWFVLMRGRKN